MGKEGRDCAAPWGALAERGRVTGKSGSGSEAAYTVTSDDRPGMTFEGIGSETEAAEGDKVCFLGFSDGTGRILYKL